MNTYSGSSKILRPTAWIRVIHIADSTPLVLTIDGKAVNVYGMAAFRAPDDAPYREISVPSGLTVEAGDVGDAFPGAVSWMPALDGDGNLPVTVNGAANVQIGSPVDSNGYVKIANIPSQTAYTCAFGTEATAPLDGATLGDTGALAAAVYEVRIVLSATAAEATSEWSVQETGTSTFNMKLAVQAGVTTIGPLYRNVANNDHLIVKTTGNFGASNKVSAHIFVRNVAG